MASPDPATDNLVRSIFEDPRTSVLLEGAGRIRIDVVKYMRALRAAREGKDQLPVIARVLPGFLLEVEVEGYDPKAGPVGLSDDEVEGLIDIVLAGLSTEDLKDSGHTLGPDCPACDALEAAEDGADGEPLAIDVDMDPRFKEMLETALAEGLPEAEKPSEG